MNKFIKELKRKVKKINLKKQIKDKYFWVSVVSLIVLTAQTFDFTCLPKDFEGTMNSLLTVFVGLGILNNNGYEYNEEEQDSED